MSTRSKHESHLDFSFWEFLLARICFYAFLIELNQYFDLLSWIIYKPVSLAQDNLLQMLIVLYIDVYPALLKPIFATRSN